MLLYLSCPLLFFFSPCGSNFHVCRDGDHGHLIFFFLIISDLNLARKKLTQQSNTLWNYRSELAIDGIADTCSFTPREPDDRWWQVNLGRQFDVAAVGITITPGGRGQYYVYLL